jgi:hypothetical protein
LNIPNNILYYTRYARRTIHFADPVTIRAVGADLPPFSFAWTMACDGRGARGV